MERMAGPNAGAARAGPGSSDSFGRLRAFSNYVFERSSNTVPLGKVHPPFSSTVHLTKKLKLKLKLELELELKLD